MVRQKNISLKKALKSNLVGCTKLAVLGVGSELRADDAAGMAACAEIKKGIAGTKKKIPTRIFPGSTAPENFTGQIKSYNPSHVLILDSVDIKGRPGSIYLFQPEEIGKGVSFSTHKMPARVLVDYLLSSMKCKIIIIGVQPKTVEFDKGMTKSVSNSVKELSRQIALIIRHGG